MGPVVSRSRYAGFIGGFGLLLVVVVLVSTLLGSSDEAAGIAPGGKLAPFAVPLVLSDLPGDANIATRAHQGQAGNVPACSVRGAQILNVCQLAEQGPVVLALFVDGGSCAAILADMQAIAPAFPGVRFAAVAIGADRSQLRRLVRSRHLSLPVGIDKDGALASLYKVVSCPQVNFAYPGGVVQSKALLSNPTRASLRVRVTELVVASRVRGWRG